MVRLMTGLMAMMFAGSALAAEAARQPTGGLGSLFLPLMLVVVFYFLLIRPQSKRAKEHRELVASVGVGDEVVTSGGILGTIIEVKDNFVVLEVAEGLKIKMQRQSVGAVLPKGTIKSI